MPTFPLPSRIAIPFVLLACCAAAAPAFATQPLTDQVVVGERKGRIFPSECCWMPLPPSERLRAMKQAGFSCSAIGGPVGVFEVRDRKLWLTGLFTCSGAVALGEVYPDMTSPAPATWVSGKVRLALDYLCVTGKTGNVYASEMELTLDKGEVTASAERRADTSACRP